eukprot:2214317-Alexandrium_andersonii.AAC.1
MARRAWSASGGGPGPLTGGCGTLTWATGLKMGGEFPCSSTATGGKCSPIKSSTSSLGAAL